MFEAVRKRVSRVLSTFVHNSKTSLSDLVRNRNAFLALVSVVAVLKLLYCAVAPASFDLQYIAEFGTRHFPIGPWISLYPPLYLPSVSDATLLHEWAAAPPITSLNFMVLSLLFRLPIFVFDIATMVALYYTGKHLSSSVSGRLASLIWFANPYSLFAIELLGVPDVAATLLMIVAVNLLVSRRFVLSGVFLGLGIWVKFYPILLLPAILLFAPRYGASRKYNGAILCFGLIGLAGYLGWVLPPTFAIEPLTQYSPVTQLLPFIGGPSWFSGASFVMLLFYCLLGLFAKRAKSALGTMLLTLLVYYALSNPFPQYLAWAIPLMALDVASANRSRALLFAITYVLAFAQWFLTSALLTPSGYSALMIQITAQFGGNLPWYSKMIGNFLGSETVRSMVLPLVSSAFFASILVYAFEIVSSWFQSPKTTS